MLKFSKLPLFAVLALMMFTFTACDDDDPEPEETPETITKLTLTFTDESDVNNVATIFYLDDDGDGPNTGTFTPATGFKLDASTTYTLTLKFEDTIGNEDITEEIEEENDEHQIFFSYTGGIFTNSSTDYNDFDDNSLPVGLSTDWTTGATAGTTGNFTVTLKHQPGLKSATSDINTGETDITQTFSIELE